MKVQESERPQFSIQRTKLMLGQVFRRSVVGGLSMLFMPFAQSQKLTPTLDCKPILRNQACSTCGCRIEDRPSHRLQIMSGAVQKVKSAEIWAEQGYGWNFQVPIVIVPYLS